MHALKSGQYGAAGVCNGVSTIRQQHDKAPTDLSSSFTGWSRFSDCYSEIVDFRHFHGAFNKSGMNYFPLLADGSACISMPSCASGKRVALRQKCIIFLEGGMPIFHSLGSGVSFNTILASKLLMIRTDFI